MHLLHCERSINSNPFIGFAGDVARRTRKRNEPRTTTISLPGASSSRGYHLPLRTRHFIPLSLRGNAHFLSLIFGQPFCICYFIQAFHAAGVVTKCEMFMHAKIKRTYRVAFCDSSHYPKNQFLMAAKWTRSGLYFYWFWCSWKLWFFRTVILHVRFWKPKESNSLLRKYLLKVRLQANFIRNEDGR